MIGMRVLPKEPTMTRSYFSFAWCLVVGLALSFGAYAGESKNKIVLQLTDNDPEKQVLVLNVAQNLLKSYGKDVQIEIVAFGPGLPMLMENNPYSKRVQSLAKKGIRFSACRNTLTKMSKLIGEDLVLDQNVHKVSGGAEHIIELVNQGYILIRP